MTETTKLDDRPAAEQWKGQNVTRKEDQRLLRGQGHFADDWKLPGQLYVHIIRSPYGHARIRHVDVSQAEAIPGVVTLTGAEVRALSEPFAQIAPPPGGNLHDYCLAQDTARFMGEPVVAVAAATRQLARDAADLVQVDYEPLDAVVEAEQALAPGAPVLHEQVGSNRIWHEVFDWGDIDGALEQADKVLTLDRLHFHRFSSTPLEANAAVVDYDKGGGQWTFYCNNQMPQFSMMFMAPALRTTPANLRFVTHDIGGAFGIKITSYVYLTLLALLARKAGRPVKWTEGRSEHIAGSAHGNERIFLDVKVPVMNDGEILGVSVRALDDVGAYTRYEPLGGVIWSQVVPGCYRMRNVRVDYTTIVTNKCPVGPNRGYSRLQHLWLLERVVDIVGHQLALDPVEVRKRNYIPADAFPYETPNGCIYDSGDYHRMLDLALDLVRYDDWKKLREEAKGSDQLIGIGIGSTLDSGSNNFGQSRIVNRHLPYSGNGEMANAKLDLFGEVVVTLGSVPQGQSHETTAAQVAADVLGVSLDQVFVRPGHDTERNTYTGFSGTYASQFAVTGLGAVEGAAKKLRSEIVEVAAAMLGADATEIVLNGGATRLKADPERSLTFAEIVGLVHTNNTVLPPDLDVTLNCNHLYRVPLSLPDVDRKYGNLTLTYASQVHVCVLEIDEETGQPRILDYAAVDDSGRRIHPQIVEGQVHGATGHGIAAALGETLQYGPDGQLLNANFFDYKVATALDLPDVKDGAIESPSPFTANGAKGMGEGGGAPLHAVASALQDAMSHRSGAIVTQSYNSMESIRALLRAEGSQGVRMESRR
jgi:2-furoyl-CoA dehydrogenase large subunit